MTVSQKPEFLPCPFCGHDEPHFFPPTHSKTDPYDPADRSFAMARCMGCFTDVPGDNFDYTMKSAIKAWNTRDDVSHRVVAVHGKFHFEKHPPMLTVYIDGELVIYSIKDEAGNKIEGSNSTISGVD